MDNISILPDSLKQFDNIKAFDLMAAARLRAVEVENVLVYLINTVDESILPYLAEQFGVSGNSGWLSANTTEQKRQLIKNGIYLNRKVGTVFAIKEVMKSLGFGESALTEGAGGHWANFDIIIDLANAQGFDGETATRLTALINEYKNARSHLLGISFVTNLTDELLTITDDLVFNVGFDTNIEDEIVFVNAGLYDDSFAFDGSRIFDDENDTLIFNQE